MSGGLMSGGLMSGGLMSGGLMSGGLMSGGLMSGGLMSGGLMSGGLKSYDRLISQASRRFISKELGAYMQCVPANQRLYRCCFGENCHGPKTASRTKVYFAINMPYPCLFDNKCMFNTGKRIHCSVPARPISEGAAPCPYWLAPCQKKLFTKKNLFIFYFYKM